MILVNLTFHSFFFSFFNDINLIHIGIFELEDTLKQQTQKLAHFKDRMESIISENEELRARQQHDTSTPHQNNFGPTSPINAELIAELHERVAILLDENALLIEQKIVLSNELDSQQALLQSQASELQQARHLTSSERNEVSSLLQRVEAAEKERDEAAKHALQCSDALGKSETEIDTLQTQLSLLRTQLKAAIANEQEVTKKLQNMTYQVDENSSYQLQHVKACENRVREISTLLTQKTQDLDIAHEAVRKLKLEYASTRKDAEGMLAVLSGMERQLNEYSARETVLNTQITAAHAMHQEALIIQEKATSKSQFYENEISRLLSERKSSLQSRQEEIQNAVTNVQNAIKDQFLEFQVQIDTLAKRNGSILLELEHASRDVFSKNETIERLQKALEENRLFRESQTRQFAEQISTLSVQKEHETASKVDLQEQNRELRLQLDKIRLSYDQNRLQLTQQESKKTEEILTLRANLRDITLQLAEKTRLVTRKNLEMESLSQDFSLQSVALTRSGNDEITTLKHAKTENDRLIADLEQQLHTAEQRFQTVIDQLKDKYHVQCSALESKLRHESERMKQILTHQKQLEGNIAELQAERVSLTRQVEEAREGNRLTEDALVVTKAALGEVSQQLQVSQSMREEAVYRAARAIEEMR